MYYSLFFCIVSSCSKSNAKFYMSIDRNFISSIKNNLCLFRTAMGSGGINEHLIRFSNFSLQFERDIGCAQIPIVSFTVGKRC